MPDTSRRKLRISLLLWFADHVYDANVRVLAFRNGLGLRWKTSTETHYARVANWCWKQLVVHSTEDEALAVGNRRLAPLGLCLVREMPRYLHAVESPPGPTAWTVNASPTDRN